MKFPAAVIIAFGLAAFSLGAAGLTDAQTNDTVPGSSAGETPRLVLSPAQRSAIYAAVGRDRSKIATPQFAPTIGAEVPPMIELYQLPERILAENRAANYYEYTLVQNKVVLVDPTRMRVTDVIGPP